MRSPRKIPRSDRRTGNAVPNVPEGEDALTWTAATETFDKSVPRICAGPPGLMLEKTFFARPGKDAAAFAPICGSESTRLRKLGLKSGAERLQARLATARP